MDAMLSRRTAVRAGALVAFLLVAGGVSACPKTGDQAEEAGQFDRLIGTDPQEAWETLVSEGWFPPSSATQTAVPQERLPSSSTTTRRISRRMRATTLRAHCTRSSRVPSGRAALTYGWPKRHRYLRTLPGHRGRRGVEQLEEAGFTDVQVVEEGDVDASRNRVKACDPVPISWALLDEEVTLTITSDVEMPDLVGMTPVDASAELIRSGLVPDSEALTNEGYYGRNPVVTSTSVPAGSIVRVGDTIAVEYSEPVS